MSVEESAIQVPKEKSKMIGSNGNRGSTDYEQKCADFIRMLAESKEQVTLIHHPQVIGDTYDEIVECLNRLSDAKKHLVIVPRSEP